MAQKRWGQISKTSKLQFPILDKIGESVKDRKKMKCYMTFMLGTQYYFLMFIKDATLLFVSLLVLEKQNMIKLDGNCNEGVTARD